LVYAGKLSIEESLLVLYTSRLMVRAAVTSPMNMISNK